MRTQPHFATKVVADGVALVRVLPNDDISDPDYILGLVQRGESLPDGRSITREMVAAAKERLAYHKPKLATTTERSGPTKPLPDMTDDELRAIIAREIETRSGGDGTAGAPGGAEVVPVVVPADAVAPEPGARRPSPFAMFQTPESG